MSARFQGSAATAKVAAMTANANAKILEAAGTLLYGENWQSPLARDLDVAVRTVQRWISGERECPDLTGELQVLLTTRRKAMDELILKLAKRW